MFNGKFISRKSGTSQKTGNEYYQLELIATTTSGGAKVLQLLAVRTLLPLRNCTI